MKLAIYGYGNLGKSAEAGVPYFPDIELTGIFTRREPSSVESHGTPVYNAQDILLHKDEIDVLFIAGGSATDLPIMTPTLAENFNVVDSFDNHAHISEHYTAVDAAAKKNDHIALISSGWDPGMFSIARIYSESILPDGKTYTFWGRGVSQGHSDAIRRIKGVVDARQYTVPVESALQAVRYGKNPELNSKTMHIRECYVVAEKNANLTRIENEIKNMPDYFEGYETTVKFITAEDMKAEHQRLPHGGFVIRSGSTGAGNCSHTIEYNLKLDSNPEFTSSVILAFSRAVYRMYGDGLRGCKTVFDIAPKYLSPYSDEELREHLL